MKYAVITKFGGIETVKAEDMYEAVMNLPWNEGYEPLAIVKVGEDE